MVNGEHPGTGALPRALVSVFNVTEEWTLQQGSLGHTSCKEKIKLKLFSVNVEVHKSFM